MPMSLPFDSYGGGGRCLLGKPPSGNGSSRRGYGLAVFEQCGTVCVYCGYEMAASYEGWLNLSIDHVIPTWTGKLGYPAEWIADTVNLVTCCRACNEFLNGYRVTDPPPATVEAFFDLRDKHFLHKREWVLARHASERTWYQQQHPPRISEGEHGVA
jgi:hypothetical protein